MTFGNWYREFQPDCVEKLAVNPKKFCEVKDAIKRVFQTVDETKYLQGKKLIILHGPPGSGKTATLNLAVNFINQESKQWELRGIPTLPYIYINRFDPYPIGSSFNESSRFYESAITRFKDWINDNVWFATPEALKNNFKVQILLLDELPFISNNKGQKDGFLREIRNYLRREDIRMPIIWKITETSVNNEDWKHEEYKSVDTVYNTVAIDILKDRKVTHIKFLPVAQTYLKKGLTAFLDWKFPKDEVIKRECVTNIMNQVVASGVNDIRQALNSIQHAYTLMETMGKIPSFISPHKYSRAGKLLNAPRKPIYSPKKPSIELSKETVSEIRSIINESISFEKRVDQFKCLDLVFEVNKKSDVVNPNPRRIICNMQIDYEKFGELTFSNYLDHFSSMAELARASEVFSDYDLLTANNYNKRNCSLILINGLIDSRKQRSPKTGLISHKGNVLFDFNRSMRENKGTLWSIKRGKLHLFEKDAIDTRNENFITNHSKEDLAMSVLPYLRRMSKFDRSNVLKISRNGKVRLNEFGKFRRIVG